MSADNKSGNNKDESFDLLAHEKRISELYQNSMQHKDEEPSTQLDSRIVAIAKQHLADNSNIITKDQTASQPMSSNKSIQKRTPKIWQWPISIAASIGILGVLLVTQRDYFLTPDDMVANNADLLSSPIMRAPVNRTTETMAKEGVAEMSFQSMQITASDQQREVHVDQAFTALKKSRVSISQPPKVVKEKMLDWSMLEENSAKTSPMSLFELSKLAEVLKLELAIQNMSELEASALIIKMQNTLFEHLIGYQKSHPEFVITEKYLNVLTEKQVQQLTDIKAVTEN